MCARAPGRRSKEVEEKEEEVGGGGGRWRDGYVRSQAFSSGSHLLSVGLLPSGSRHGVLQSLADWINLAADPRTTWKNQTTRCEKARTGNKGAGGQGGVLAVIPDVYATLLCWRDIILLFACITIGIRSALNAYTLREMTELTLLNFVKLGVHAFAEKEKLWTSPEVLYRALTANLLLTQDVSLNEK